MRSAVPGPRWPADLLGVADGTVSAWHKEKGSDRAGYVAARLSQERQLAGLE